MSTQLESARDGILTPILLAVAEGEHASPDTVREQVALGHAVIPANPAHNPSRPAVVGRSYRTKVNANLGRSAERSSLEEEIEKLRIALDAGADFVMDLSVGKDLAAFRRTMLAHSPVPLGTVPIYEALSRVGGRADELSAGLLLSVIREQAEEGVDFMTLHAGLLARHVPLAAERRMGIVSRGGAILAEWMLKYDQENPLYTHWDEVMEICARHDVTVSLGDGLRPGCLADASDSAQFAEMDVLGELVRRCRTRGVQVMVEGPGHIPFNEIQMNMEREQTVCDRAPFYVLGPVVTDIAPGYDHITSCIGATAAAYYGASLLCYVTPAEHLGLPCNDDVKAGVIAYRQNFDWDRQFRLALDPETARTRYERSRAPGSSGTDYCSMCGKEFCAIRTSKRVRDESRKKTG